MQDILHRGKRPVLVGGTGLYLDSLVRGGDFAPGRSGGAVRERLQRELAERGAPAMLECLREVDPESAARLHLRDEKRILRALEVYEETGETITAHNRRTQERPPRYDALYIGLDFADRADLRARIDRRVDEMVRQGLLQEVETLLSSGVPRDATALQAIGYRQFLAVRDGRRHGGGRHRGGQAPLPPVRQAPADVAAPERGHPLDPLGKRTGFPGGSPECDRISHRPWLRIEPGGPCIARRPHQKTERMQTTMQKKNNLQEIFLTRARKENVPVTMFLINGFQLRGTVTGFDCFTVVLDCDGRQNVIYKHAISTIAPQHPISLMEDGAT